jgi:LPXTG-site transpeptidase (sortase) family protein
MRGVLSLLLLIVGLGGLVFLYGPVVRVEVAYQMKRMADQMGIQDWKELFIPNFNVVLAKPEMVRDYALVIPKIYLQEKIFVNVDPTNKDEYSEVLKEGIAHAAGTEIPGNGGMGYYFAHSSGTTGGPQQKAEFYLLNKLEPGDEVQVFYERKLHRYRVSEKRVVWPSDLSFLTEPYDRERIVLQTCWPIGTDLQRLLVFGERV